MPHTSTAKKRLRQSEKRNLRNRMRKTRLKSVTKDVLIATDAATAAESLKAAYRELDMAAKKGVIHPNTAARRKARLAKKVDGLK